jgi:hypothetical protein
MIYGDQYRNIPTSGGAQQAELVTVWLRAAD